MEPDPAHIVIRCPNWVGDIVMATPVLECLREGWPEARITAVVRAYAEGILRDCPWVDRILPCRDKTWGGFRALVRELRNDRGDLGILLPHSTRAFLELHLGRCRHVVGYRRGIHRFLLDGGPRPPRDANGFVPEPMVHSYLRLCGFLGLSLPEHPKPRLFVNPGLEAQAAEYLRDLGIGDTDTVIGLNPGAKFGSSKCWPPEYFARLADGLHRETHAALLLLVGPGEEEIARRIVESADAPIANTADRIADLALLKPVIRRCDLLITNDTGPRHYAVAFDVPTVVLMGPTDPRWTAANLEHTTVLREDVECSPCHLKTCPIDHRCMRDITPDRVLEAALSHL